MTSATEDFSASEKAFHGVLLRCGSSGHSPDAGTAAPPSRPQFAAHLSRYRYTGYPWEGTDNYPGTYQPMASRPIGRIRQRILLAMEGSRTMIHRTTENSRYLDVERVTMPDVLVPEQLHG